MSNSFYHKDLTDAQWNRIKIVFEELELDSTFCKVHQSACSALKDQAIGSSRGGKNTKVHVLINERMQLLKVILNGGQIHDSEPALALLNGIKLKGKTILADKAYSSEHIRFFIAEHGAFACIPDKANFKIKHDFDSQLYKQRNIVERFFSANQKLPPRLHSLRQIGSLLFQFRFTCCLCYSLLIYQQPLKGTTTNASNYHSKDFTEEKIIERLT